MSRPSCSSATALAIEERQSHSYHDEAMVRFQTEYVKAVTHAKSMGINIDAHLSQFSVSAEPLAEDNEPTILLVLNAVNGGGATRYIMRASSSADVLANGLAGDSRSIEQHTLALRAPVAQSTITSPPPDSSPIKSDCFNGVSWAAGHRTVQRCRHESVSWERPGSAQGS